MERRLWSKVLTAPKRGEFGLLEFIRESYDRYQIEVINQHKLYQRYAEDFINGHEFHDAIDARSKNEHQTNYNIIKTLLLCRRDLVENYFNKNMTDVEMREMLTLFNTTLPSSISVVPARKSYDQSEVSLCPSLDKWDYEALAVSCNEAKVFCEDVDGKTLSSLFNNNIQSPLHARNNRLIAFLFNQLSIYDLIIRNWQNVIDIQKSIISSTKKAPLTQKALSSAVYANTNLEMSSQQKIIERAIESIRKKNQRIRNFDR